MDFPRDIELKILSKLDMDGRIKMGIIGKLTIPDDVRQRLEEMNIPSHDVGTRFRIQMRKKRSFVIIIAWDSATQEKMVSYLRPGLLFDYWYANDDHTSWNYLLQ